MWFTYLVNVDCRVPLVISQQVEVPHTDLTEVTRMVLVEICAVVVLSGCVSHFIDCFRSSIVAIGVFGLT